jgi:Helicase HerA, central domain
MEIEKGQFFVGLDPESRQPILIDGSDFTTHGVIVGMTGSGKTGLGVGILEEALLSGTPCLIIDPKGDMGNLLLDFPDFRADDFRPWIDEAAAEKDGKTPDSLAEETARMWEKGLTEIDIDPERMRRLADTSEMTIYTPGSSAGVPLDVLGSMNAPSLDWESNAEIMRDEIEGLVSSLLVMAGVESDPVSGPEHILLANIVETHWRDGKDLDLATLIGQIPKPPFRKLGVFEVDAFFPAKERMSLALELNGLLASPSFAGWMEGRPLDIEDLLAGGDKTKAAIIYLAHLSDSERQFMVTLLLSKLVTWMRGQPGTSNLRVLVYMDEVFGYVPPTAEPPSKKPILTILKQARAHGVGMILSTQNPVDLDYKAMSNAGTWMVGRLQTENDKKRILEGLTDVGGEVDVGLLDRLISDLPKRRFVLHSTHESEPRVFDTRWAMSYLAGPLTREQVSSLMEEKRAGMPTESPVTEKGEVPSPVEAADPGGVPVMPVVADSVGVVFMDPAAPWRNEVGADPDSARLVPAAAAIVDLLYDDTAADIDHRETFEAIICPLGPALDTAAVKAVDHDPRDFTTDAPTGKVFAISDATIENKAYWAHLSSELRDWLVSRKKTVIFRNVELKLFSRVDESRDEFADRCRREAKDRADAEMAKLKEKYRVRIDRARQTLSKAETRARELEVEASSRQQSELLEGAGDILGAFLGGKKSSTALGQAAKRRAASQKASERAELAKQAVSDDEAAMKELEEELASDLAALSDQHADSADSIEEIEIPLEKSDVKVRELKLVWLPIAGDN